MLGIFSWNIGDNAKKKIPPYITEIKSKCQSLPDLLVFGFQEVQENLTLIMQEQLPEYTIINNITACQKFTTYQIVTFVMQKKNSSVYKFHLAHNECLNSKAEETILTPGTKGYTITVIQGPQNFIFVNTHFPLKSPDILQGFYTVVNNAINELKLANHLVFVFGDVNSRCYDYQKEVKTCANANDQQLDYCKAKASLEILEFPKTFNFASLPPSQIMDPLITQLITTLTTKDFIKLNQNEIFNGYTEPEIRFLPTYKRDEEGGQFDLVKPSKTLLGYKFSQDEEKAGRLPGYADRIFYRNDPNIQCLNYGSFGVKGNDHLPIGGIFTIQTTGGRLRKKSRTRSKSRSAKSKNSKSRSAKSRVTQRKKSQSRKKN
jgi:hypothetical protein